jgi:hypothetical protein
VAVEKSCNDCGDSIIVERGARPSNLDGSPHNCGNKSSGARGKSADEQRDIRKAVALKAAVAYSGAKVQMLLPDEAAKFTAKSVIDIYRAFLAALDEA